MTDTEALAVLRERGLPNHETVVEIPKALLGFAPGRGAETAIPFASQAIATTQASR